MSMERQEKNRSIAEEVFDRIEEAILEGEFPPGELLTENKLCQRLSVSRTPIREALTRLRQKGLIEETGRGAVVLGLSEKDLSDIYEIRIRVEGFTTALCAQIMTDEQLTALEETVALQEFYTARGQADTIKNLDSRFHEQLYTHCGSGVLAAVLSDLHRKVRRFRRASVEDPARAAAAVREHREILGALRARNGKLAEQLAITHIQNARASVIKAQTGEH